MMISLHPGYIRELIYAYQTYQLGGFALLLTHLECSGISRRGACT
ncbi:hypothetical protein IFVP182_C290057 [Vibrio parahaemolyticus]